MKNKSEDVVFISDSRNITLKNLKATHIEHDGPLGCTGSAIQVYDNNDILIEKCALNGSGIIGVVAYETRNLKIVDNYIYNNSRYGVLYTNTSVEINNNKFEDNGPNGNDHVAEGLNGGLSEIVPIEGNVNKRDIQMSGNTFIQSPDSM